MKAHCSLLLSGFLVVTASSATQSASPSPSPSAAMAPTRVEVSKLQPGEARDSVVKEIGGPDVVLDQANGEKCEAYGLQRNGQETFRQKLKLRSVLTSYLFSYNYYYDSPDQWQGLDLNKVVVLCYRKKKLVRVLSKPCPSPACSKAPSLPGFLSGPDR